MLTAGKDCNRQIDVDGNAYIEERGGETEDVYKLGPLKEFHLHALCSGEHERKQSTRVKTVRVQYQPS